MVEAGVAIAGGVAAVGGQAAHTPGSQGHDEVVLVTAVPAHPAAELFALKAVLLLGPG